MHEMGLHKRCTNGMDHENDTMNRVMADCNVRCGGKAPRETRRGNLKSLWCIAIGGILLVVSVFFFVQVWIAGASVSRESEERATKCRWVSVSQAGVSVRVSVGDGAETAC